MSSVEPRGCELIACYKANYGIPADASITEEMILRHWTLEKELRLELLASTPGDRRLVFERSYTRLYQEFDWLNTLAGEAEPDTERPALFHAIIGTPPQRIYEVGSGKGDLIRYLAAQGFECGATEITQERGEKRTEEADTLSWRSSDGVHLAQFEPKDAYDVVVSDQVFEHLHPDDALLHLENTHAILKPGGRCILSTPHRAVGPVDVTRVFGHAEPMGMHLKEYTYGELSRLFTAAGFEAAAVLRLPGPLRRALKTRPRVSRAYLRHLILLERPILMIGAHSLRLRTARAARALLFNGDIVLVGRKPG